MLDSLILSSCDAGITLDSIVAVRFSFLRLTDRRVKMKSGWKTFLWFPLLSFLSIATDP